MYLKFNVDVLSECHYPLYNTSSFAYLTFSDFSWKIPLIYSAAS